jgi:hypothetical protein
MAHLAERDYSNEKPVPDDVFQSYRSFYAYDHGPLNPSTDAVDDTSPNWRTEKVSFQAAYGDERVPAYLLLP